MPPEPPPRVSIVLVVHDAADVLLRCLGAVARLPEDIPFEVVLVDDGSTDATPAMLEAIEGDFVALRNDGSIGYGPSCDRGVAESGGEVVVLLSAYAVPVDGWLEPLVAALGDGGATGAARPRAVDVDGRIVDGALWPCLAVKRAAYDTVGGFAAASRAARPDKVALVDALVAGGFAVVDEPASLVLVLPETNPGAT